MKNTNTVSPVPTVLTNKKKGFWHTLGKQKALVLMSVPFVLYIVLFCYVPLWGWTMAFQDYKPAKSFSQQTWVGFQQFKNLVFKHDFKTGGIAHDKAGNVIYNTEFLHSLRNTVCMSLISTVLGYITAIVLAILLNEVKHVGIKRFVQTVSYLPHFLSWIIVTSLVSNILATSDGTLNNLLLSLGFIDEPVKWLMEPKYFWNIIGWSYVWKEVGWNTIVYLGAMTAIDPCLYEAAEIDGCGRWRKIWNITLPGIRSTIIIMMIMSAGHILDANFEMPYFLKNGMTQDVAINIDIYTLQYGIKLSNYSIATAAGIFKNLVNIILLLIANWLAKIFGEERLI